MSGRYCDAATARKLVGLLERAVEATTNQRVMVVVPIVRGALSGDDRPSRWTVWDAAFWLQTIAPRDLGPLDSELYAAAISLCSALCHVHAGTDASVALDKTLEHLNRALDHHTPVVVESGPRSGVGR